MSSVLFWCREISSNLVEARALLDDAETDARCGGSELCAVREGLAALIEAVDAVQAAVMAAAEGVRK